MLEHALVEEVRKETTPETTSVPTKHAMYGAHVVVQSAGMDEHASRFEQCAKAPQIVQDADTERQSASAAGVRQYDHTVQSVVKQ